MTKGTREKWAERIREWRESGLSAEGFTAGKDDAASSLRAAILELEGPKRRSASPKGPSGEKPAAAEWTPRFVPVRTLSTTPGGGEVVVEVGGARIRVSRGADLALVGELVRLFQGVSR